jgi:hypothetical protein
MRPDHIVLEGCIAAVEATTRRDRLEAHIEAALPDWSLAWTVQALQAVCGVGLVAADTLGLSLATSPASPIPASSWRLSGWCGPSIPAAARDARAELPRPAMEQRDAC